MQMLATFRRVNSGFSLIELLVTLLIIGLLGGIVGPNIMSWLDARTFRQNRDLIASYVETLPLQARSKNERIEISENLSLNTITVSFTEPVIVLANGFCLGGRGSFVARNREFSFEVTAPFCKVTGL